MKHEFSNQPETFKEEYPSQLSTFSWMDFVTAIPSPIFLVTTYKDNGKPTPMNAETGENFGTCLGVIEKYKEDENI